MNSKLFFVLAGLLLVSAALVAPLVIAKQAPLDRSIENGFFVFDKYSRVNYQPFVLCPGEKDLRFYQDPHPLYVKGAC